MKLSKTTFSHPISRCINYRLPVELEGSDPQLRLYEQSKSTSIPLTERIIYVYQIQTEITKEIKRFERMQIDLKSNLDRLQYKIDHESKVRRSNSTVFLTFRIF